MTDNGEMAGELYTWVHKLYLLDTWKATYAFTVEPIKGKSMWPKDDCPTTIIPPPHHIMAGRPKKKRRVSMEERMSQKKKTSQMEGVIASQTQSQGSTQVDKLTRKYGSATCGKCKQKGHNSRTCNSQGGRKAVGGRSQGAGEGQGAGQGQGQG